MNDKIFSPPSQSIFSSRDAKDDPRLGDFILNTVSNDKPAVILAGYPDDEGIKNNGGRIGANEAPDRIRHFLYKMTPPLIVKKMPTILDLGNLTTSPSLEAKHSLLSESILSKISSGYKWIGLGGGHDYGFPDGEALIKLAQSYSQKPLVINFDAHLDVRPLTDRINSGTPFFRLLDQYPDVDFLEIGIQNQCNSQLHLEWLQSRGGKVLFNEEILSSHNNPYVTILKFLEPWLLKKRLTYLSIDIDVFKSSEAPGCSQSWPLGLSANDFFKVLEVLTTRLDIRVFGVYEVSPPLDVADITSKLAAQIVYQFITNNT